MLTMLIINSTNAGITSLTLGDGDDGLASFDYAASWNSLVTIDGGGGGYDDLYLQGSGQTYDLTHPAMLTGFEALYLYGSNNTVLVDDASLAGFSTISGDLGNTLLTADTSLDLSGKFVSNVTVASGNATGTMFEVDNKPTAFQVVGGAGHDTLNASALSFTAAELDYLFMVTSIETVIDQNGTTSKPGLPANTLVLTAGSDSLSASADNYTIKGTAATLTSGDSLDGGSGTDTLKLFGGGTFNLNTPNVLSNFEEVRLVNFAGNSAATLTLRDGTTSDVYVESLSSTQINVLGTAATGIVQGGDGQENVKLANSATAGTIALGNGDYQGVDVFDDASVQSIVENGYSSHVYLYSNAHAGSITLNGSDYQNVQINGNASVGTLTFGNGDYNQVYLYSNAHVGSLAFGNGDNNQAFMGSTNAGITSLTLGDGDDGLASFDYAASWNSLVTVDGGGGYDYLDLQGSGQTYDLTHPATLTGFEALSLYGSNTTVLVDDASLASFSTISGDLGNTLLTADTSLDLSGKFVSNVTVASGNATGTTFEVDNKETAFQIVGGLAGYDRDKLVRIRLARTRSHFHLFIDRSDSRHLGHIRQQRRQHTHRHKRRRQHRGWRGR